MSKTSYKKNDWVTRKVIYMYFSGGRPRFGMHICYAKTDAEAEKSCKDSVIVKHFIWKVITEYH